MSKLSVLFVVLALSAPLHGCTRAEDGSSSSRTQSRSTQGNESRERASTSDAGSRDGAVAALYDDAGLETPRSDDGATPSAQDQSVGDSDETITRRIRQSLVDDSSLSWAARNATIVTEERGVVTLRGGVVSTAERDAVGGHARSVSGVTRVENLLVVDR